MDQTTDPDEQTTVEEGKSSAKPYVDVCNETVVCNACTDRFQSTFASRMRNDV